MPFDDFAHNPRTLLHIAGALRNRGVSPLELFRRVGVPPSALLDANGWVPRQLCFALSEEAGIVSGDRFLISKIGASFELVDFGPWGRTIAGARSVGEACAVAANNVELLHQGSALRFFTFARHAELRFEYHGRLGASPHQHLLGSMVFLRKIALLAKVPEAVSVRLSIPYSHGAECLEETCGPRLEFGCDYDSIVIDRSILDASIGDVGPNPIEVAETAEATGALLKRLLPYGRANLETVAAHLRVSARTVQRRLRDWGFSFEEILDDVRRTEATRHVISGENSAIEIAFLLGYSDPAHFTRAFRRWTGMPPRDYARAFRSNYS
ncbi:MAG: helix-turn-helix domain-containing protein [Bauldia sp.]|uniref:AraC family transcriptional regulator n=1 Tax=Bauldia sp. TaxID=2575872 RepID=UPI001E11B133|nr:AraC family transcriptional regulator [Bauldia sp.]MCB1496854.1 helix-turn-helix domain-containing protein [Bauldia sp.]